MDLFLGYDPGGRDCHGVAAAEISRDGSFVKDPKTAIVRDAAEALEWLSQHGGATFLGIDTLLAWSRKGGRACDDWLRQKYKGRGGPSVIAQNSLYSSMTLNGAMVAMEMKRRKPSLLLCESHPKLQMSADFLLIEVAKFHAALGTQNKNDHSGDALVAAWCASRWHYRAWTVDLFKLPLSDNDLVFPAGEAVYPWPKSALARQ